MRFDLPDQFSVSGLDPATGLPATRIVLALGDDRLTATTGPAAASPTTQVFEAGVFEAGVFE